MTATKTIDCITAIRAGERRYGDFFLDSIRDWLGLEGTLDGLRERLEAFFGYPVSLTMTGEDTVDVTFQFDTAEDATEFALAVL